MNQPADVTARGSKSVWWFRPRAKEQVSPQDEILEEFSAEVKNASKLLNFLMSEGHFCHISDQIIDDIEYSRELLTTSKNPSNEDRAKLLKAYRDLVNTRPGILLHLR